MRLVFTGSIAGIGSSSGVRVVVGRWLESPFGAVSDAMVETREGRRILLAPTQQLATFIASTYIFDEIRVEPFEVRVVDDLWHVSSESLTVRLRIGHRTPLGWLLRWVPVRLATKPAWCALIDPVARVMLRGVRTRGTAGGGRREWYGASDLHSIAEVSGTFEGRDLGTLASVEPPCRFGFSSTPTRPVITDVTTTIDVGS